MTLLDVVRLLRKNIVILLVGALVGVALAAAYTLTRPSIYQAQATGLVVVADTGSVGAATAGDLLAQQRAESYVNLVGTRAVAARVNQTVTGKGQPVGSYWASNVKGTSFIRVSGSGTTAASAQATADAALAALVAEALRMETYGQVQTMATPPADAQLRRLTGIHILPYESAALPGAPARPNLVRNVLIGLVAGLVLGVAWAFTRRKLDVRVRTQQDVENITGHSVLGVIPDGKDLRKQRKGGVEALSGQSGESLRKLRTNLRFVNVDDPLKSFVVTSANPGEGKSTIASNLARLMALSGQPVVLLDCDLRRPMQATAFGIDSTVGLSQVLAGDVSVTDALVSTDVPGLRVLPAGRIPPNPSELVGSRKMAELIAELSRNALVIIDAPPMLAVTDASLLARASGGALFVTLTGKTPKDQIAHCMKQLELVGAKMLGTVLNRVPKRAMGELVYGHSYGYAAKSEVYYVDGAGTSTSNEVIPAAPMSVKQGTSAKAFAKQPHGANGATHAGLRARRGVVVDDTTIHDAPHN
ncbi:polysaccharide biosynthesis tyrosine autokinase [Propionibacteriaceae bacterium G1746]|uniref:polysaccharide biosynthesis tyrosine autokinase n=1 Tax=Aestuariimicrobium sp. G57 TaxID=3418485 RepID=UPI003C1356AA